MDPQAVHLEYTKLIVTSIITLFAAGFSIVIQLRMRKIAQRQADIAREAREVSAAKLNLDLFDRRMVIFEHAFELINSAARTSRYDIDVFHRFQRRLHEAGFLFGADVLTFLMKLRLMAIQQQAAFDQIGGSNRFLQVDGKNDPRLLELKDWFEEQSNEIRVVFLPYMSFESWRSNQQLGPERSHLNAARA